MRTPLLQHHTRAQRARTPTPTRVTRGNSAFHRAAGKVLWRPAHSRDRGPVGRVIGGKTRGCPGCWGSHPTGGSVASPMEDIGPQAARPRLQLPGPGGPGPGMQGSCLPPTPRTHRWARAAATERRQEGHAPRPEPRFTAPTCPGLGKRRAGFHAHGPVSLLALHRLVVSPPPWAFLASTVRALAEQFPPLHLPPVWGSNRLSPKGAGKLLLAPGVSPSVPLGAVASAAAPGAQAQPGPSGFSSSLLSTWSPQTVVVGGLPEEDGSEGQAGNKAGFAGNTRQVCRAGHTRARRTSP